MKSNLKRRFIHAIIIGFIIFFVINIIHYLLIDNGPQLINYSFSGVLALSFVYSFWLYIFLTFIYLKWGENCGTNYCMFLKAMAICLIGVLMLNVPNFWDLQFRAASEVNWSTSGEILIILSVAPLLFITAKNIYFKTLNH